ncbi:YbhB/YbcL family Raf kinase inhibitor-like protein [Kitasatospora sp. LaBMicrA B282]|uniref:YbhB/YbcL family Raf kinase inhibitor-like protein n=1 Tax=Kitasatospora sp. LaBMicrA B282 TaxID=3420949 RepID=UPI003D100066
MQKSTRTATALGAAAISVLALGTSAATAHGGGRPGRPSYGYTAVRKGVPGTAVRFTVTSPQVHDGGRFPADAWADAFGCSGGNQQVQLAWQGAPAATRSYAVTMFDPDAPTGAGFWHWLTWDIPAGTDTLGGTLPAGAVAGTDDAGVTGYLGPCPPAGDPAHHYQITVYALDVPSLGLPAATPATVTAFSMSSHIIGYARMTVTAQR